MTKLKLFEVEFEYYSDFREKVNIAAATLSDAMNLADSVPKATIKSIRETGEVIVERA